LDKIERLRKLISDSPKDPLLHYSLARLYVQASQLPEAEQSFKKVLELKPDYSIVYLELGKVLEKQKKFDEAIALYERGIPVAEAKGDLMPKKQMELCLKQLLLSSRT